MAQQCSGGLLSWLLLVATDSDDAIRLESSDPLGGVAKFVEDGMGVLTGPATSSEVAGSFRKTLG